MAEKCIKCGSVSVEPGNLQSTGEVVFRPSDAKFVSAKTANISLEANLCMDCGFVELFGDRHKLQELKK